MKKLLVPASVAAVVAVAAVPAFAATKTVKVDDNKFGPTSVSISKGSAVKFRWVGERPHNVKRASGPSFRGIDARKSGSVSRKFSRKGTYKLLCTIHPGMNLTVRVR